MTREGRPDEEAPTPPAAEAPEIGDVLNADHGPQRVSEPYNDLPADEPMNGLAPAAERRRRADGTAVNVETDGASVMIVSTRKLPPLPYGFRVLPNPQAVSDARRRLAAVARAWGRLNDEAIRDLELCAAELIANAARHTAAPCAVDMRCTSTAVRVSVTDTSPELPREHPPGPLDEDGRGLTVVTHLATTWGVEPDPAGKVVWFDIAPAGRTGSPRLVTLLKATASRVPLSTADPMSTAPAANRVRPAEPVTAAIRNR